MSRAVEHGLDILNNKQVWDALISVAPEDPGSNLLSWHRRLAHLNMKEVWNLGSSGKLSGQWESTFVPRICDACIKGKGKRLPSPSTLIRAKEPRHVVHVDLWGPAPVLSAGGN